MSLAIQFGKATKPRNSTFVPSVGASTQCLLKDDTSLIRPVFRIHHAYAGAPSLAELSQMNYCYVPEFKRYYYITNVISETAAISLIVCEVDVLASFRADILNTPAFVMYAESRYNTMLPDNRLPISDSSQSFVYKFPLEICDSEGCFVLTVASPDSSGETGPSSSFCLNAAQMTEVARNLYAQDVFEAIKIDFYHPDEALLSCIWTPFKYNEVGGASSYVIQFGKYQLGTGQTAERTIFGNCMVTPHIEYVGVDEEGNPNAWADYRNVEPYSTYTLYLPGVGEVGIPMYNLLGMGDTQPQIQIGIAASPMTGDIVYNIERLCNMNGSPINVGNKQMVYRGNLGVQIPIASAKNGFLNGMISGIAAAGNAVIAAKSPTFIGRAFATVSAVQGAASAIVSAEQISFSGSGSLGGWTLNEQEVSNIECTTTVHYISDNPSNIRKTIGRPLFANVSRLGSLKGFVQCTGAFVETWATEEELQMISQYVNSAIGSFGGIIIE